MDQTLTLREAGTRLGVSGKALKRLIRSGVLPEAHKVSSPSGRSWAIPVEALPAIAERQGWVIDLTGDEPFLDTDDKAGNDHNLPLDTSPLNNEDETSNGLSGHEVSNRNLETIVDPFNSAMGANSPLLNDPEALPQASRMADVYDLSTAQGNTVPYSIQSRLQSDDGNSSQPSFERDRTGTEDPSPNDIKFRGAPTAMNPTPISNDSTPASESSDNSQTNDGPKQGVETRTEIDLSTGTDLATVEMGALIPHRAKHEVEAPTEADAPSLADVLDVALLDRLLGAQEEKANALAKARQTEDSLTALSERNEQALSELEVVRREADLTADRLREERMARIVADAKVAELRDRVIREMTLADSEKHARVEATMRNIQAERENANAFASMGWMARRRFRRASRDENQR